MPRKKRTELDELLKYMKQKEELSLQLERDPKDKKARLNKEIAEANIKYYSEIINENLLKLADDISAPKGASREEMIESATDFRDRTYPESDPMKRYQREALSAYIDFLNDEK